VLDQEKAHDCGQSHHRQTYLKVLRTTKSGMLNAKVVIKANGETKKAGMQGWAAASAGTWQGKTLRRWERISISTVTLKLLQRVIK